MEYSVSKEKLTHKSFQDSPYLDKGALPWEGGLTGFSSPIFLDAGGEMKELQAIRLFELGDINRLLLLQAGGRSGDYHQEIILALLRLNAFVNAKENKENLPDTINQVNIFFLPLLNTLKDNNDIILTKNLVNHIDSAINDFCRLLESEPGKLYIILLEEKAGHSVQTLWKHQLTLLTKGVSSHLSNFVKGNLIEAAKCLVLNCYTAVGFHCVRSIEHVARQYYELIKGVKPINPDGRFKPLASIAQELLDYNESLKKNKNNELVIIASLIKAINKEKRDPLAHPEIIALQEDEAIEIFRDTLQVVIKIVNDAKQGAKGTVHFTVPWKRGFLF